MINKYGLRNKLQNNSRSKHLQKINQYTGGVVIGMIKQHSKINVIQIIEILKSNLDIDLSVNTTLLYTKSKVSRSVDSSKIFYK